MVTLANGAKRRARPAAMMMLTSTNMPPWLEAMVAEGLKLMKQLHDQLPLEVQKVTAQIPGEIIITAIIVIMLFHIVTFLINVKVGYIWYMARGGVREGVE